MKVTWFGLRGLVRSLSPASSGVWFPFLLLHFIQAQTRFSHVSSPPRVRGITWSMVSGKISTTTILASIPVAPQNIFSGEDNPLVRNAIKYRESQDTRHRQRRRHRPQNPPVIPLNKFRLPQVKQDNRFFPTANCERLIILI